MPENTLEMEIFVSSHIDNYEDPVFHTRQDCGSVKYIYENENLERVIVPDIIQPVRVPWSDKKLDLCEHCQEIINDEIIRR